VFAYRAAGLIGVVVALHAPPAGVDLVPELTSAPFGATGGQSVTHTIRLSGTGTGNITGVRVTFTTTVGLDAAVASSTQGHCSVADARTVVCDLGAVAFPAATSQPTVTIRGTLPPGTARGTLVQNQVTLAATPLDADASNNQASNAYLIPSLSDGPSSRPAAAAPTAASPTPGYLVPVAAGVLAIAALAGAILLRRRGH
jgi:Domain of unknown function DUF11